MLDGFGNLSISNIAVIAFSIKVISMPQLELTGLVAFMTVVANYNAKRLLSKTDRKKLDKMQSDPPKSSDASLPIP